MKFGPYHLARFEALSRELDIWGIELCGVEEKYEWKRQSRNPRILTLTDGAHENVGTVALVLAVFKCLRKLKPDVIFIPGYSEPACLAAALWGILCAGRNILMSDSTAIDRPRKRTVEMFKSFLVKNLFHGGFVSGKRALRYLTHLGMPHSKICLGYDAVDNDYFYQGCAICRRTSSPEASGVPRHYFLCVARLAGEKNIELLLRSFFRYRSRGGVWSLVVVGNGPLDRELKAIAAKSEHGELVTFAGHKSSSEIIPYYAFASALILPSQSEPWGLVINEAMACGLPVIASQACGACDDLIVNGETGFVFDPRSDSELCEAMLTMSQMPREKYEAIAAESRRGVGVYSIEAFRMSAVSAVMAASSGVR